MPSALLSLSLALLFPIVWAQVEPQTPVDADAFRESRRLEGITPEFDPAGGPPRLLEFQFDPDSGLVLRDLGPADVAVSPLSGSPEIPADPENEIWMSTETFLRLAVVVRDMGTGAHRRNQWGYDVEDGKLRLYASRGFSLLALGVVAAVLAVALGGAVAVVRLRRTQRQRDALVTAQRQQAAAREAERTRLAREIHDGPIQDLHALRAVLSAQAVLASGAAASGDSPSPGLDDVSESLSAIAHELRAVAEGLRPPALGRFGLAAALSAHAGRVRERHPHVEIDVRAEEDGGPGGSLLSEPARVALFRVAQEAITNAVTHGNARRVEVEVTFEPTADAPEQVRLEVRDDGRGLPSGGPGEPTSLAAGGHFGLVGMHERAALLGGLFALEPGGLNAGGDGATYRARQPGVTARLVVPWSAVTADAP